MDELKVEKMPSSMSKKSDGSSPGKKKVKFEEKQQAAQSPELQPPQVKSKSFLNFKKLDEDF